EEPFLPPLRSVNRGEVHAREAEDPPELIGARRPEAGEVVVEQDVRAGDPVLHRSESAGPFLHLRSAVNLDATQIAQGTIADEPEIDEIRGDFRSRVQVLHFVPDERHLPPSEGLEDVRSHPGAVTEFDRVPVVPGSAIEEREQAVPAVVVVQKRRELDHEGRDLRSQLADRPEKTIEGLPGRTKRILMGDEAGELRGEQEGPGNGVAPRSNRLRGRNRVERRVDLHEVEHLAVQPEEIGLRRLSRVEGADPEFVRVADAPDAQVHGPAHRGGGRWFLRTRGRRILCVPLSRGMSPRGATPHGRTRSSFTYRTPSPTSPKRICFFTPWARRTARLISGHAPRWPFGTTWTRYLAWCVSGSPSYARKWEPYLRPDLEITPRPVRSSQTRRR